ncbi:36.4 kDa proline-rich protein-like [Momordica charantia]|uniref:36.4 kDa proline-rich protein-like n=1 Tax=Momordica charantia TaxID=3673 RepID=A0A6J1BUR2_MOMCH|nr:36.4 kDa proline-rich protein-like [Momordica charantia]
MNSTLFPQSLTMGKLAGAAAFILLFNLSFLLHALASVDDVACDCDHHPKPKPPPHKPPHYPPKPPKSPPYKPVKPSPPPYVPKPPVVKPSPPPYVPKPPAVKPSPPPYIPKPPVVKPSPPPYVQPPVFKPPPPPPYVPTPTPSPPVKPAPVVPTPAPPTETPCPPPPKPETCPIDTLKLGACVDLLGGLIHIGIGDHAKDTCCPVLQGLVDLDAAVCLCTTIKAKLLNINLIIPIALQVLIDCGKHPPNGFQCPAH